MISVEESTSKSLDRASVLLAGVPGGMEKAVKSAMSRVGQYTRTHYTDYISDEYAVAGSKVKNYTTVSVNYTLGQGVQAEINFKGTKIPLYQYSGSSPKQPGWDWNTQTPIKLSDGSWRMFHPGKAAAGHQLSSTGAVKFTNAFTATMSNGHTGIFERNSDNTISEIMGSAGPQMLANSDVEQEITEMAAAKLDERLEHEVARLLGF